MNLQLKLSPAQFTRITIVTSVLIVLLLSFFKYSSGDINYRNSDATWHTLLTIQAYEETPITVHKFLPIVTLGAPEDKGIPWGLYLGDEAGNYYYTSFSWLGYFLPWAFIKICHLPINEQSLYIFNTLLQILSVISWILLIGLFYRDNKHRNILLPMAVLPVIFAPEIMHGMGIVYWHQSLMQVTLPLQMIAYLLWRRDQSNRAKYAFYALTLINPMIEWTGYVANVGFAVLEFVLTRKNALSKRSILAIMSLTAAAFVLFSLHYLQAVSFQDYFTTLYNRFLTRSIAGKSAVLGVYSANVFTGYIHSFWAWWIVVLVLLLWALIQNGKVELKHPWVLFILAFIMIENLIMSEHAICYTFDRMKLVFFLSFVTCELFDQILTQSSHLKRTCMVIFPIALLCAGMNFHHYLSSPDYIWRANYRSRNQIFADYINANYPNSYLGTRAIPRGYTTLLFHRNIIEPPWPLVETAKARHARYAIMLNFKGERGINYYGLQMTTSTVNWNMLELERADVLDLETNTTHYLSLDNGSQVVRSDRIISN